MINTAGHLVGPFEVESALIEHPAVAEAGGQLGAARGRERDAGPARPGTAGGQRRHGRPVVGALPSYDLPAFRLPDGGEVADGGPDRGVDRFGPAAYQGHPVESGWKPLLPEHLDEGDPLLGDPWRDDVGDPLRGMGDGRGHLGAPVADVDGHRPTAGVDDLPAS